MYRKLTIVGLSATFALTACSGSGTSPKTPTQGNLGANVLQFSIGTANIYGDQPGGVAGINVAATYRQGKGQLAPGDSAVAVSGPTLTIPNTFTAPASANGDASGSTIAFGPASTEEDTSSISYSAQTLGSPTLSSFGTSGGVFGLGIEPFNINSESGQPFSYTPYALPLFDPNSGNDLAVNGAGSSIIPSGFPPAFPSTGVSPAQGYSMGLDVLANTAPAAGTYSLNVAVPVKPVFNVSKSATLGSTALLPGFVQGTPSLDSNDDGGATIPVTLPAGVTEAYVQIYDVGPTTGTSCNGSAPGAGAAAYTIFVNASGNATLAGNLGPGGKPSICTVNLNTAANGTATSSDQFVIELIGFDYPAYEASYPNSNGNPSPTIAGANGQSDITISTAFTYYYPAGGGGGATIKSVKAKQSLMRAHKSAFMRR